MHDIALSELLSSRGFEGESAQLALDRLCRHGLTRPGKSRIAEAKIAAVDEILGAAFFRHCRKPACRPSVPDSREPVLVSAGHCESCGGSDNRRAVEEMLAAMQCAGWTKLLVAGGSPGTRGDLERLCRGRLELRFITGETTPNRKIAGPLLDWSRCDRDLDLERDTAQGDGRAARPEGSQGSAARRLNRSGIGPGTSCEAVGGSASGGRRAAGRRSPPGEARHHRFVGDHLHVVRREPGEGQTGRDFGPAAPGAVVDPGPEFDHGIARLEHRHAAMMVGAGVGPPGAGIAPRRAALGDPPAIDTQAERPAPGVTVAVGRVFPGLPFCLEIGTGRAARFAVRDRRPALAAAAAGPPGRPTAPVRHRAGFPCTARTPCRLRPAGLCRSGCTGRPRAGPCGAGMTGPWHCGGRSRHWRRHRSLPAALAMA